jgi:Na+/proline symporter
VFYAILMGLAVMWVVPTDIRLPWQWGIGFAVALAAAWIARRFTRRISRVAIIAISAALAAAGLVFLYTPPLAMNANPDVVFYRIYDSSHIVVAFLLAAIVALAVDFLTTSRKSATS